MSGKGSAQNHQVAIAISEKTLEGRTETSDVKIETKVEDSPSRASLEEGSNTALLVCYLEGWRLYVTIAG